MMQKINFNVFNMVNFFQIFISRIPEILTVSNFWLTVYTKRKKKNLNERGKILKKHILDYICVKLHSKIRKINKLTADYKK